MVKKLLFVVVDKKNPNKFSVKQIASCHHSKCPRELTNKLLSIYLDHGVGMTEQDLLEHNINTNKNYTMEEYFRTEVFGHPDVKKWIVFCKEIGTESEDGEPQNMDVIAYTGLGDTTFENEKITIISYFFNPKYNKFIDDVNEYITMESYRMGKQPQILMPAGQEPMKDYEVLRCSSDGRCNILKHTRPARSDAP